MARPSKFNRDEAIAFAMNEIWRDGYEANSLKALSEKLGITRSSFYNAFGSRAALFREVLELYFQQAPDRVLADATPDMSIKKLLSEMFFSLCKSRSKDAQARGCLGVNGIAQLCNTNDEFGPLLQDAVLDRIVHLEVLLGWAVANGEIDGETDIHALALSVQNLLIGLNVMSKVVREEADLVVVVRTTLRGLGLLEET